MTKEQVLEVTKKYQGLLNKRYDVPMEAPFDLEPGSEAVVGRHLLHMCGKIQDFLADYETEAGSHEDLEKAMRWLGFIQGVFWSEGAFSLNEMRQHNAPDCEAK